MSVMTESKVFCEECKFFVDSIYAGCMHPNNRGTWRSRNEIRGKPEFINALNDCPWFKRLGEEEI